MLLDGDEIDIANAGQQWATSWHSPTWTPDGVAHGAAGICLTPAREVVLVSADGDAWEFPGGRPESGESWEDTLRREMREEACADVVDARLLGFCRGRCVAGAELGRVLVRSIWRATVQLRPWDPQFEIRARCVVPIDSAIGRVIPGYQRVWERAFHEAALM